MKGVKESEDLLVTLRNRTSRQYGRGKITREDHDWLQDAIESLAQRIEEMEEKS